MTHLHLLRCSALRRLSRLCRKSIASARPQATTLIEASPWHWAISLGMLLAWAAHLDAAAPAVQFETVEVADSRGGLLLQLTAEYSQNRHIHQ